MTWPEFLAINKFWKKWPPPCVSLAILARIAPQQMDRDTADAGLVDPEQSEANIAALTEFMNR